MVVFLHALQLLVEVSILLPLLLDVSKFSIDLSVFLLKDDLVLIVVNEITEGTDDGLGDKLQKVLTEP